ncbi:uncharacterized protein LOC111099877 isoform X2 [Crassostrea virginica]
MALTIIYWARYVVNHTKLTRKSERAVDSDRVLKFLLDKELHVISAVVQGRCEIRPTNFRASRTNVKCSWIKHPKSAPPKTTTTIGEMYPPRKQEYSYALDFIE